MHVLINAISNYVNPSTELIDCLNARIKQVSYKKGDLVHDAHDICQHSYFIESGIFRLFYLKSDGREVSDFFASENTWINSPVSFMQQKADVYYMDAIEDTQALALGVEDLVFMFDNFPEMERYSRLDMGTFFAHVPATAKIMPALLSGDLHTAFSIMIEDPDAVEKASIAVEKINGCILMISARKDEMRPSTMMSERLVERLKKHQFSHPYQHIKSAGDHASVLNYFTEIFDFLHQHFK